MATKVGEAYYDITARVDKLEAELKKATASVEQHAKKSESFFTTARMGYLAVAAAVAVVAKVILEAVDAAADFAREAAKFKNVFGDQFERASESVKNLTENYIMSDDEAMKYLSTTQNLLTSMGLSGKTAAGYSDEIVKLASDMGAFNNVPTADALQAITMALAGGTRSLRQYGVVLNDDMVQREAQRLGLTSLYQELSEGNKAQATYSLILKQTANQQGQTARSTEQYGFIVKQLKVNLEEANQAFGLKMLPGATSLANVFKTMTEQGSAFRRMLESFGTVGGKSLAGLAVTVALLNVALERAATGWDRLFNEGGKGTALWEQNQKSIEKANKLLDDAANKYETLSFFENKTLEATEKLNAEREKAARNVERLANKIKATDEEKLEIEKELARWNPFAGGDFAAMAEKYQTGLEKWTKAFQEGKITADQFAAAVKKLNEQLAFDYAQALIKNVMGALTTIGQIIATINQAQIEAIDKQISNFEKVNEAMKNQALESAGFAQDTDEAKNRKELQALRERLKVEQNETKKAELQKQILAKEREAKKFQIEQDYANRKLLFDELMERKKRKLTREAAEYQKAVAIATAVIQTAVAAISAFQSLSSIMIVGPILGAIAAAAVAAFGAAEIALIAATPLPTAAEGMITNRPAIFGEAGPEMAIPLAGASGRKTIQLFSDALVDAVNSRTGPDTHGTISGLGGEGVLLHNVVYIDGDKIYDKISKATRNGKLLIHSRAVV